MGIDRGCGCGDKSGARFRNQYVPRLHLAAWNRHNRVLDKQNMEKSAPRAASSGLLPESQDQDLALTPFYVPDPSKVLVRIEGV